MQCGLLGTVASIVGGERREVVRTTPEAIDLQRDFAAMLAAGDRACAMEVSSHALELGRVEACASPRRCSPTSPRTTSTSTRTMEDYFQAKRRLFAMDAGARVVNVDDPYGRRLADEFPDAVTFAVERRGRLPRARRALGLRPGRPSWPRRPTGRSSSRTPLPGRFNVSNALGAVAAARALGVSRRGDRRRAARGGPGARALRAGGGGPGVRGARRLRAHAGLAGERAARRARADRRAA